MTALAVIFALVTALCIGYHAGRRAGSTRSTWKKRIARVALGGLALSVIAVLIARGTRRTFRTRRTLADAAGIWGLKSLEPLRFRRGALGGERTRSRPGFLHQLPF